MSKTKLTRPVVNSALKLKSINEMIKISRESRMAENKNLFAAKSSFSTSDTKAAIENPEKSIPAKIYKTVFAFISKNKKFTPVQ